MTRNNLSRALPLLLAGPSAVAATCSVEFFESVVQVNPNATVNYAYAVEEGGSFGPASLAYPDPATNLPAVCAVSVNIQSSTNTSYNFGLFLPDTTWNERFLATGNGALNGGINWKNMGVFTHYGFAAMSTDTGHNASSASDGSWGLNNPDAIINWAHRAMHGSVELSKTIVTEYYAQKEIQYSYYVSCSTGGRQGLREIQLYPDDFDGASVGAPAWYATHLSPHTLKWTMLSDPTDSDAKVDPSLFPAIVDEMVKQCDPQDGVTDGIVSDPFACNFNFERLLCTPSNSTNCLTPAQLQTIYHFYHDWVDVNQTWVFPGITVGTDPTTLLTSVSPIGYGYFRNFIYNDTEWDYTQFSYKDVLKSEEVNPGNATAWDFDLSPFMNRKGKVLHYHGTADGLIPTGSSTFFYNKVTEAMTTQGIDLDDFYRFFLVPGMEHCQGSDVAPWYFAGGSQYVNNLTYGVPDYNDPAHNIVLALMNWVENGTAPEQIIATKYYNDTYTDGMQSQRPLCMYPKQAKYTGSGDVNDPENWECKSLY